MGKSGSKESSSDEESYVIQPELAWKHRRATVRAKHQLNFAKEKRPCDYCRIIKNCRTLTEYYCVECKLFFCFSRKHNHFRKWHSPRRDEIRSFT